MSAEKFMMNGHSVLLFVLILMASVVLLAVIKYFGAGALRVLRRRWGDLVSPKKAVSARIKEKRLANFIKYHTYDNGIRSTGTRYFAAFVLEDDTNVELELNKKEYGKLKENDSGTLRFKGSRFLGFERA